MTDSTASRQTQVTSTPAAVSSAGVGSDNLPFIVFQLETSLIIQQFPTPLPDPLQNYQPTYTTLPDGSLLTSLYRADLFSANSRLFGIGALLTLGAINVWTSVSYIKRGKVKDKTLFYLLLASQALLPTCFGALLAPFFLGNVDCTTVNIIAVIATELSYAILITGILGLKAYRCLSRSRFILIVVWVFQLSIFTLFALDIRGINSLRRIGGSCGTDGVLKFTPIALVSTVIETFFLALCFLYAVWKSILDPAAQGQLSIALSEKAAVEDPRDDLIRRGWWDYVPRAPESEGGSVRPQRASTIMSGRNADGDSFVRRLRDSIMRLTAGIDLEHQALEPLEPMTFIRKPSIPTEFPLSQPPRPRHLSQRSQILEKDKVGANKADRQGTSTKARLPEVPPSAHATSVKSINFAPQTVSQRSSRIDPLQPEPLRRYENRLDSTDHIASEHVPAALQIRAVIRDEMIYTTLIMLSCVLAAAVSFWRSRENDVAFGPSVWLGANWTAVSLLVMHTFSKVVKRHERDAILQSTSAYSGPLLSKNDFGLNVAAIAVARRRRDALALARDGSFGLLPQEVQSHRQRKPARRSSWDSVSGTGQSLHLFADNASLRRQEGLRAWEQEKERQRERQNLEDPFSDFHLLAKVGVSDGEGGDVVGRKRDEGPLGAEELALDSESIHRGMVLQEPVIVSRWGEAPFIHVDFGAQEANNAASTAIDGERDLISGRRRSISPLQIEAGIGRRGSTASTPSNEDGDRPRFFQPFSQSTNLGVGIGRSFGWAGPVPARARVRRGAIAD